MVNHPNRRRPAKPTHTMPSGMGGIFPVIILGPAEAPGFVTVKVITLHAGDWHGKQFDVHESALSLIETKPNVDTPS